MEEIYKNYEKTIRKKHVFSYNPKYQETFTTTVNNILFIAISEKAFEKLDWTIVYKDENSIEAKRREKNLGIETMSEVIIATYENCNIVVKSESLGNEIWDAGRNSKRVKLFIYAFHEILKTFDVQALNKLEKEVETVNNWDNYGIPEILPPPIVPIVPRAYIPIIGGLISAIILGFLLAFVSVKGIYILGLFEFFIAIAIAFVMKYLIRWSNFINLDRLLLLASIMILIIYASNQYFQYEIILYENNYERIGFWEFFKLRFSSGLTIKSFNVGRTGLVISWILELGLSLLFVALRLTPVVSQYIIEKVPNEVAEYAYYLIIKDHTADEVRVELAKKGWTNATNQDEVFQALAGYESIRDQNRMK